MRTSTSSLIATLVATLCLLTSPAPAQSGQSTSPNDKARPSKSAKPSMSARPSMSAKKKAKNYDFLADEIDGARILPDETTIFGREVVVHDSLIRLRTEFISEILKSAE